MSLPLNFVAQGRGKQVEWGNSQGAACGKVPHPLTLERRNHILCSRNFFPNLERVFYVCNISHIISFPIHLWVKLRAIQL